MKTSMKEKPLTVTEVKRIYKRLSWYLNHDGAGKKMTVLSSSALRVYCQCMAFLLRRICELKKDK